jgi:hypothetical protein
MARSVFFTYLLRKDHSNRGACQCSHQVPHINKRQRRPSLQNHISGNAAAQRRDHRQSSDADQVIFVARVAHRGQRSTERSHKDAEKVDQ